MNYLSNAVFPFEIVLGSASPRRKEILSNILGFVPKVSTLDIEENTDPNVSLELQPLKIANDKFRAIIKSGKIAKNDVLITADTMVLLENEILGKPKDKSDAKKMLQKLSGKVHRVITGVVLGKSLENHTEFSSTTLVFFNQLTEKEIDFYVETFSPLDKAGAYAIQEWIGMIGIKKIEGCYYNVMGLPANELFYRLKTI